MDGYQIVSEAISIYEQPFIPDQFNINKFETIDMAVDKLSIEHSIFKDLPPAEQQALLKRKEQIKKLKKAGKIGAALLLAIAVLKTLKYYKERKNGRI